MTRQVVTTTPHNSGLGDPAFTAFEKVNANEAELYAAAGVTGASALSAATYAIARTLTGTATGDRLQVLGRTSQSDGGQGLFTWVAGGSTTVDEGYILQAIGGTWNRVDPSPTTGETLLNAVWFNIKPGNADTVNDTGFAKLKAQMQTSDTTTWRVFFPPGAYTYQVNRWLFNVQRVIIDAYDCTFQCTSTDPNYQNGIPLFTGDNFWTYGDVIYGGTPTYTSGYLINTAASGATAITTTTAGDAGNFTPGMRVLIHGYDQQGAGYPPNLRYFEMRTVLTAVAGTGVITLTKPLQFNYDSRWWDTANYGGITGFSAGAPRVLSLERANWKRSPLLWFKGMSWLANPTTPTFAFLQGTADFYICEDVTAMFGPSECDRVLFRRCSGISSAAASYTSSEIDKLIASMTVEDSVFDGSAGNQSALTAATGCIALTLRRTRFHGAVSAVLPRHLSVDDCDIVPLSTQFSGIGVAGNDVPPLTTLCISNTRIYNPGGSVFTGVATGTLNAISFTVGTVSGTNIQLTWDATAKILAHSIDYGMTLSKSDGTKSGVVTGIYLTGGNTLVITGTWAAAPVAAETWNATSNVINQSDGGGNSIIGPQTISFWRYSNQLTLPPDLVLPGNPSVGTQLSWPGTGNLIRKASGADGLQFLAGNTATFYALANQLLLNPGTTLFLDSATPLRIDAGGSPPSAGLAVLVGGTKTITHANVTNANFRVFVCSNKDGGTPGWLKVNITDFTSFTITSSSGTDTSSVAWWLFKSF